MKSCALNLKKTIIRTKYCRKITSGVVFKAKKFRKEIYISIITNQNFGDLIFWEFMVKKSSIVLNAVLGLLLALLSETLGIYF